jgi:hypothetical protein
MNEVFRLLEKIRLPVEKEVWGMFTGSFPQDFVPGSILFVGDDGNGTLADLAAKTYPGIHINIVDRSPDITRQLTPKAEKLGWSVFTGYINNPDTVEKIRRSTSGGADAVFMKHGVYLNSPENQKTMVADLFRLSREGGVVGWSIPAATEGWLARRREEFVDTTIRHDILHSTVHMGTNTPERQQRSRGLFM